MMIQYKLELFSLASIGVSSYFAKKHLGKTDTKGFKRDTALSIIACGIIALLLPF